MAAARALGALSLQKLHRFSQIACMCSRGLHIRVLRLLKPSRQASGAESLGRTCLTSTLAPAPRPPRNLPGSGCASMFARRLAQASRLLHDAGGGGGAYGDGGSSSAEAAAAPAAAAAAPRPDIDPSPRLPSGSTNGAAMGIALSRTGGPLCWDAAVVGRTAELEGRPGAPRAALTLTATDPHAPLQCSSSALWRWLWCGAR